MKCSVCGLEYPNVEFHTIVDHPSLWKRFRERTWEYDPVIALAFVAVVATYIENVV